MIRAVGNVNCSHGRHTCNPEADWRRWLRADCRLVGHQITARLREAGSFGFKPQLASSKTARGVETITSQNPVAPVSRRQRDSDPGA